MDDNEYLESEEITRLEQFAMFPDMNLIEQTWYMLSKAVSSRRNLPRTIPELLIAAKEK